MLRPTPSNLAPRQRICTSIDLKIQSPAARNGAATYPLPFSGGGSVCTYHGYADATWVLHIDGCGGEVVVSVSGLGLVLGVSGAVYEAMVVSC